MKFRTCASLLLVLICNSAFSQLRVATWNISNYGGGRTADIQTAVYTSFSGRTMAPDIILCQEFQTAAAITSFKSALNTAPGSPGDWDAAPFVSGPDTNSAFFYRTTKVTFLGTTVVSVGGSVPAPPRTILRYDVRLIGYTSAGATLACYSTHMKAQDSGTSDDETQRLTEATNIRNNAATLPAGWHFLLGGDLNIYTSTEAAYQKLVASEANNLGRLFDPIKSPANWNNSLSWRFIHTQDPTGNGGMDDRFDQILLSANLIDGTAFEYLGNPNIPYSTTTWNDANHSYRCWGNDGTSYNLAMTIAGNAMVGATIAQALANCATTAGGHLPVFLDLRVPPVVGTSGTTSFGKVALGSFAELLLTVSNAGNTAKWTANGISTLTYALSVSGSVSGPIGNYAAAAGASGNVHSILLNTSSAGVKSGSVTLTSNDPDTPSKVVSYSGEVFQYVVPTFMIIGPGLQIGGDIGKLASSDDQKLPLQVNLSAEEAGDPITVVLEATSPVQSPFRIEFQYETAVEIDGVERRLALYDWTTGLYVPVDTRFASLNDSSFVIAAPGLQSRFVENGTKRIRARISFEAVAAEVDIAWKAWIDQAVWRITP